MALGSVSAHVNDGLSNRGARWAASPGTTLMTKALRDDALVITVANVDGESALWGGFAIHVVRAAAIRTLLLDSRR